MTEPKDLPNSRKVGVWLWQMGIVVPDGNSAEFPICPFCTTSPFREPVESPLLPDRCPECGAKLNIEK